MKEFTVTENDEVLTLLKFSFRILESAPQSIIRKFLRNKNIELNEKKADGSERLKAGDSIRFWLSDETFDKFSERLITPADQTHGNIPDITQDMIIYEDNDFLILNKPAGILSQSDSSGKASVNDMLLKYAGSGLTYHPSVCNRLDMNTSGLIICGKSIKGIQIMDTAIKERRIDKYYRCFCSGHIQHDMHIEGYLKKDSYRNKVTVYADQQHGSEKIVTEIKVIEQFRNDSYLEIKLITGKAHQIRAHLASLGHPLIGDMKYGSRDKAIGRQMLHSYRIEMPDDILGGRKFTAELPEDMINVYMELKRS